MKERRKWKGALATRIPITHDTCHTDQARLSKLSPLFDHYLINDKEDYRRLVLALAIDHVPGFATRLVKYVRSDGDYGTPVPDIKSGRPRMWSSEKLAALLDAVSELKERGKAQTDREALFALSRRADWSAPLNHRGERSQWIETLESRLQDAKNANEREVFANKLADQMFEHARVIAIELGIMNSGNDKAI
jgi:hypothetical protein